MRSLCDCREDGGKELAMSEIQNFTIYQARMFCADKKNLRSGKVLGSFKEAAAIWRERKKNGNQAR